MSTLTVQLVGVKDQSNARLVQMDFTKNLINTVFHVPTNCKCDKLNPCIDCLSGKYGVSDLCVNDCPSTCVECTNSTLCTSCKIGYHGPACQYDSDSHTDNVTDDDDGSGRGKNNGPSISVSYTCLFFWIGMCLLWCQVA